MSEIEKQMASMMDGIQALVAGIQGQSEQIGVMNSRLNKFSERMDGMCDDLDTLKRETTITRPMCRRIRKAVMSRVNKLLEIEYEGGRVADECIKTDTLYRGGFISRCYTDAKNHSKMGESYSETLKVDFDEVMKYIEAWKPEVEGGVEGYKHYLDIRREEREKKQVA